MRYLLLLLLTAGCGGAPFSADLLADRDAAEASAPDAPDPDGGLPEADGGGSGQDALAEVGDVQVEACTLVTHTDGVGQTWQDCSLLGIHNMTEALAACRANGGTQCVANNCGDSGSYAICDVDPHSPGYCSCWVYSGPLAGHVDNTAGCTTAVQATQASCGSTASDTWQ